jgi:hypothetical protein
MTYFHPEEEFQVASRVHEVLPRLPIRPGKPQNPGDSGHRLFIEYDREMAGIGRSYWVTDMSKDVAAPDITGNSGRSQEPPFANPLVVGSSPTRPTNSW